MSLCKALNNFVCRACFVFRRARARAAAPTGMRRHENTRYKTFLQGVDEPGRLELVAYELFDTDEAERASKRRTDKWRRDGDMPRPKDEDDNDFAKRLRHMVDRAVPQTAAQRTELAAARQAAFQRARLASSAPAPRLAPDVLRAKNLFVAEIVNRELLLYEQKRGGRPAGAAAASWSKAREADAERTFFKRHMGGGVLNRAMNAGLRPWLHDHLGGRLFLADEPDAIGYRTARDKEKDFSEDTHREADLSFFNTAVQLGAGATATVALPQSIGVSTLFESEVRQQSKLVKGATTLLCRIATHGHIWGALVEFPPGFQAGYIKAHLHGKRSAETGEQHPPPLVPIPKHIEIWNTLRVTAERKSWPAAPDEASSLKFREWLGKTQREAKERQQDEALYTLHLLARWLFPEPDLPESFYDAWVARALRVCHQPMQQPVQVEQKNPWLDVKVDAHTAEHNVQKHDRDGGNCFAWDL